MANNSQFLVSMKFVGVNQVSPEMKKMADDAKKLKQQVESLGRGPSGGFKFLDQLNKGLKAASDTLGKMKKQMEEMKASGFGNILTGGAALAPVLKSLHDAGQFQQRLVTISGATGTNDLAGLKQAIRDASNVTKFSTLEVEDMAVKAATSGMTAVQVQQLTPILAKFAEVQQFGKGSSPDEAVTQAISSAHMLGIYEPDQLDKYLDKFNKATFMTPGNTTEFFDTFKYMAPTAKGMGLSNDDILYTAALANRVGFLGSMGGTEAADMILRSIPGIFGGDSHVGKDGKLKMGKQLQAMVDLGLAKPNGSSVFFNDKGQFLGIENFIKQLADASKGVNPERLMKDFKNMFGMQGERLAVILSERGGEQLQLIEKQMENMKSITQLQDDYNKSYEGQLVQFKTNLQNLNQDVGTILLPTATNFIHSIQPLATDAAKWISTHEDEVRKIAEVTAGFGALMFALGTAKIVLGTIGSVVLNPLKKGIDGVLMTVESFKTKAAVANAIPEQMIRASVVNVYGAEINGGGGGGIDVGGAGGGSKGKGKIRRTGGGNAGTADMATEEAAQVSEVAAKSGWLSRGLSATGALAKGALKRGGAMLPVSLAFGAYDVMTAPEGHKVEAAAKTSGGIIGGWAGAEAGAAMGAAIGSVVPGLGTAIGGLLGGIIGGVAGSTFGTKFGSAAYDAIHGALNKVPQDDIVDSRRSRYEARQRQLTQNTQKTYNDNSTHTYNITAPSPEDAAHQIDLLQNLNNRAFRLMNTN